MNVSPPIPDRPLIVLATLNARYSHPSLGLRCLLANLGDLQPRARMLEFDWKTEPDTVAKAILDLRPRLVGLGVYLWNVTPLTDVARRLKQQRPDLVLVLGGPEVGAEPDQPPIVRQADYVIAGEADLAFPALCRDVLAGRRPEGPVLRPPPPDPARLVLPDALYDEEDLAHKNTYVESSRGCPFLCDYCLSAGDAPVRFIPMDRVLASLQRLLDRGARRFKFVDRTFNLRPDRCEMLLSFFLERLRPGLFVHFEMVPETLPGPLGALLGRFPAGALQLELGVQTFDPEVAARIHRRLDIEAIERNLRYLREHTRAILHTDLIAGLPGETMERFGEGFDRLLGLAPHKIQVGLLKRLRGAPIDRHTTMWQMAYDPAPPYEVLSTSVLPREDVERLKRFSKYWERLTHRGHFPGLVPALREAPGGPFRTFLSLSDALHRRFGRAHAIPLPDLASAVRDALPAAGRAGS